MLDSITSIFSALCIHTITIRRGTGLTRRLAEHRAETCLLCLKEVQKYWRINNNTLDLFLQYLDRSIAARLHGMQPDAPAPPLPSTSKNMTDLKSSIAIDTPVADANLRSSPHAEYDSAAAYDIAIPNLGPGHYLAVEEFQEQYFNLISQGDDGLSDLQLFLQGEDFSQAGSGSNLLERPLWYPK